MCDTTGASPGNGSTTTVSYILLSVLHRLIDDGHDIHLNTQLLRVNPAAGDAPPPMMAACTSGQLCSYW
jgi:hypothetical protein